MHGMTRVEKKNVQRRGFTLIEVVLVVAIAVLLFLFTFGVGSEFYSSQTLISERDSLVSLLRRARAKAMSNVRQSDHGVYLTSGDFFVFEGSNYSERDENFDEGFPRLGNATTSGLSEIVFSAIDGMSNVSGAIAIATPSGEVKIFVNYEGRISL